MATPFADFMTEQDQAQQPRQQPQPQQQAQPFSDFMSAQPENVQAPPGIPHPPLPEGLGGPRRDLFTRPTLRAGTGPSEPYDYQTGKVLPQEQPTSTLGRVGKSVTNYLEDYPNIPGRAVDAAARLTRPLNPLMPTQGLDAKAGDVAQIAGAGMEMAMPFIPGQIAKAPAQTIRGLVGGYAAGKFAEKEAEMLGAGPGVQEAANVVGGVAVGLPEMLRGKPGAPQGERPAPSPEPPTTPVPEAPAPVEPLVANPPPAPAPQAPPPSAPQAPGLFPPRARTEKYSAYQARLKAFQEAQQPQPQPVAQAPPEQPASITGATPTIPEAPATLQTQIEQLQSGARRVVMAPKGSGRVETPPGMKAKVIGGVGKFIYDPSKITGAEITLANKENRLPDILGAADQGMGAPDKSQLNPNEPVAAVVARDPNGVEAQATATDQQHLPETIQQTEKVTPPGGDVSVEDPSQVIDARLQYPEYVSYMKEQNARREASPATWNHAPEGVPPGVQIFSVPNEDGGATIVAVKAGANLIPGQGSDYGIVPDSQAGAEMGPELARRGLKYSDVVGTADITSDIRDPNAILSQGTFVAPDYQRQGIGTALYRHAEQIIGKRMVNAPVQTKDGAAFFQGYRDQQPFSDFVRSEGDTANANEPTNLQPGEGLSPEPTPGPQPGPEPGSELGPSGEPQSGYSGEPIRQPVQPGEPINPADKPQPPESIPSSQLDPGESQGDGQNQNGLSNDIAPPAVPARPPGPVEQIRPIAEALQQQNQPPSPNGGQEAPGSQQVPPEQVAGAQSAEGVGPFTQFMGGLGTDQSGSIPLRAAVDPIGVRKLVTDDIIPAANSALEGASKLWDSVKSVFAPQERTAEGKQTSLNIREMGADIDMQTDRARTALELASKHFSTQPQVVTRSFLQRMEAGLPQLDENGQHSPILQQFADTMRSMLDTARTRVQDLGTGKLANFIENYVPHSWKNPDLVSKDIKARLFPARGPLTGSGNFLKMRKIPTIADGLMWGYEPMFENPVDLVIMKVGEMNKYVAGMTAIAEEKAAGRVKFFKLGSRDPSLRDGTWVKINDKLSTVYQKNSKGELILRGNYYAKAASAKLFNNYLSPGYRGGGVFDTYMGAANVMNQFQLGLSAFHAGFTTIEAMTSRLSLVSYQAARGDYVTAAKSLATVPIAPITNYRLGERMSREWHKEGSSSDGASLLARTIDRFSTVTPGQVTEMVKWAKSGGARAHMNFMFEKAPSEKMSEAFTSAWAEMNGPDPSLAKAGVRTAAGTWFGLRAGVEKFAKPIMDDLVPKQKLGALADILRYEMGRPKNQNLTHNEIRAISAKAQDVIDDRFGQMVYHNWHWDNKMKDVIQGAIRSTGWTGGTLRSFVGGVADYGTFLKKTAQGTVTAEDFTHRMSYLIALPIMTAVVNTIFQRAMAGIWPQHIWTDARDLIAPRDGGLDPNGNPSRTISPGYGGEAYNWTHHPIDTAIGKIHPLPKLLVDLYRNQSWDHTKLQNEDDPLATRAKDFGKYVLQQQEPFFIQNMIRGQANGTNWKKNAALSFIGFRPATAEMNKTLAQREMSRMTAEDHPQGNRTTSQAARYDMIGKLTRSLRLNQDISGDLQKAIDDHVLNPGDEKEILRRSEKSPFMAEFEKLSENEAQKILDDANPEERAQIQDAMQTKIDNLSRKPSEIRPDTEEWIRSHGFNDIPDTPPKRKKSTPPAIPPGMEGMVNYRQKASGAVRMPRMPRPPQAPHQPGMQR